MRRWLRSKRSRSTSQTTAYRELLKAHGISCSMSAKDCRWDNAVVESLFSTLERELDLDDDAENRISPQQLQRDLAFCIDGYYNRECRRSTLNYLSTIDIEPQFIATRRLNYAVP